jgi:hypothetical protein
MVKSRTGAAMREGEKMSFQITPFVFYLTRQNDNSGAKPAGGVAAKLDANTNPR